MNQAADQPKPSSTKGFIHRFVVGTSAVAVAVKLVPSIEYTSWEQLLIASAVLGLLNAFVRPLLVIGCLPLLILTLGLFLVVINAGLLMLTAELVEGFEVPGFWPAVWGALIISLVTLILNKLTGEGDSTFTVHRQRQSRNPREPRRFDDDDDGPVIDV